MALPTNVPPFQLQKLIAEVVDSHIFERSADSSFGQIQVSCAQALGSEIYVGCSNGNLLRFVLHDSGDQLQRYTLLSGQTIPGEKPIDDIVLIPSLSRALILSDAQIHFYTIPSLDPCPFKPIRHVLALAVDDNHLKRPSALSAPLGVTLPIEAVDFSVVKRSGIALYTLKDRLVFLKEVPLPSGHGTTVARRVGPHLCLAFKSEYNLINLDAASMIPFLPISQDGVSVVKPAIVVVGPNEFLILSWTGSNTIGVFLTGDGDPVRGTLEWAQHPEALTLDYPFLTSVMPDGSVEVYSVETQSLAHVIPAPPPSSIPSKPNSPLGSATHQRNSSTSSARSLRNIVQNVTPGIDPVKPVSVVSAVGGYQVPSTERLDKMRRVPFKLVRT